MSDELFTFTGNATKRVIVTKFSEHEKYRFSGYIAEEIKIPELKDLFFTRIFVYPTGKGIENKDFVSYMMGIKTFHFTNIVLNCTVSVIDASGCLRRLSSFGCNFFKRRGPEIEIGLERYLRRLDILSDYSGLLTNDNLTLQCEIIYSVSYNSFDPLSYSMNYYTTSLSKKSKDKANWMIRPLDHRIQDELKSLVAEKSVGTSLTLSQKDKMNGLSIEANRFKKILDETDISGIDNALLNTAIQYELESLVVETREGVVFALSPNIINRLTVIPSMFNNIFDEIESVEDGVVLCDVDGKTFNNFLNYIKYAKLEVKTTKEVCELYAMSRKYKVIKLTRDCTAYMRDNMNLLNIAEISLWAFDYNDEKLMLDIANYVNRSVRNSKSRKFCLVVVPEKATFIFNKIKEYISYSELYGGYNEETLNGKRVCTLQKIAMDCVASSLIFIKSLAEVCSLYKILKYCEAKHLSQAIHKFFEKSLRVGNMELIYQLALEVEDLVLITIVAEFEVDNEKEDASAIKFLRLYKENPDFRKCASSLHLPDKT